MEYLRVGSQDLLELVESLLKLTAIAGSQARLLAFFVLAVGAIAAAPTTRWLSTVAFHLSLLTKLARDRYWAFPLAMAVDDLRNLVLIVIVMVLIAPPLISAMVLPLTTIFF